MLSHLFIHIFPLLITWSDDQKEAEKKENELIKQQNHYKDTWYLPLNIPLEDDTLLDQIKWDETETETETEIDDKLHYLECCILLFESIQQSVESG